MQMSPSASLRGAIIDRVAAQWIALGCQLVGEPDETVIDLEALVAVTSELADDESRVADVAIDWCVAYGQAISVSRLKNVAAEILVDERRLGRFAGTVAAAGGPRWPFAAQGREYRSRGKVLVRDLGNSSRLVWRIRAAFGVNARSDVLAALLVLPDAPISVSDLSRRTRFTKRNVALAVASMGLAGVVDVERYGNGDRVHLPTSSPLRGWLIPSPTIDIDWTSRWVVVLSTLRTAEASQDASETARLVEGRATIATLSHDLRYAALPRPDLAIVGPAFAVEYDAWISSVEARLRSPAG
jgi:hypothetical protein